VSKTQKVCETNNLACLLCFVKFRTNFFVKSRKKYMAYYETPTKERNTMNLIPVKVVAKHALLNGAIIAIITIAYDTVVLLNHKK
jgi:hypothetical protein